MCAFSIPPGISGTMTEEDVAGGRIPALLRDPTPSNPPPTLNLACALQQQRRRGRGEKPFYLPRQQPARAYRTGCGDITEADRAAYFIFRRFYLICRKPGKTKTNITTCSPGVAATDCAVPVLYWLVWSALRGQFLLILRWLVPVLIGGYCQFATVNGRSGSVDCQLCVFTVGPSVDYWLLPVRVVNLPTEQR